MSNYNLQTDTILLFIIFIFSLISISSLFKVEGFASYPFRYSMFNSGWGMGSFINMPTRYTRNQSYDIRGDPFIIYPNPYLSPWGMSTIF